MTLQGLVPSEIRGGGTPLAAEASRSIGPEAKVLFQPVARGRDHASVSRMKTVGVWGERMDCDFSRRVNKP